MSFLNPFPPAYFIPKRFFAGFSAYLTISESNTDELEITQHPVHDGADITDHAYKQPSTVSIQIVFDATTGPLTEIYSNLLALQSSRVPFDMVTGKRSYKSMLLKSLSCSTDQQTENILAINASMQEIILVSVETATRTTNQKNVPVAKQADPGKTAASTDAGTKTPTFYERRLANPLNVIAP